MDNKAIYSNTVKFLLLALLIITSGIIIKFFSYEDLPSINKVYKEAENVTIKQLNTAGTLARAITATSIKQTNTGYDIMDITINSNSKFGFCNVKANAGKWQEKNELMYLNDGVEAYLKQDNNNSYLSTASITIDPKNKIAYNTLPVVMRNNSGMINATGFTANIRDYKVHFLSAISGSYKIKAV